MTSRPAAPAEPAAIPLAEARPGVLLRLVAFAARKGLERRLADLGLPKGAEVEVVHRERDGRAVIARQNIRIALGSDITRHVLVVAVSGEDARVAGAWWSLGRLGAGIRAFRRRGAKLSALRAAL